MSKLKWLVIALGVLSLFVIGCERKISGELADEGDVSDNCLACHSGYLDQAQGEWANSIHASGNSIDYTNRGAASGCAACHSQQGFLAFWETGVLPEEELDAVSAIGCFTCHNPHENGDLSIRYPDPVTLENGVVFDHGNANICVMCHHSRSDVVDEVYVGVEPGTRYGPHHGPQGDLLQGTNAWEFPGEGYTWSSSPHRDVVPDGCAGCHMGNPGETHDGYKVGGHSFQMVDEESGTELGLVCGSGSTCHVGEEEFDFVGEDSVDYDWDGVVEGYQTELEGLMDSLRTVLTTVGVWNAGGNRPVGDPIADENIAGALYNYKFLVEDRSMGIHNFEYALHLMVNSIDYVNSTIIVGSPNRIRTVVSAH